MKAITGTKLLTNYEFLLKHCYKFSLPLSLHRLKDFVIRFLKRDNTIDEFLFYFLMYYLFIYLYFWLHWVFVAARGPSLVAASGGYSLLRCAGFSLRWLLLLRSTGSRCVGFSSCGTWAQQLWLMGLAAPRPVGSSRTTARTRVPCLGRQILNHCATREALKKYS